MPMTIDLEALLSSEAYAHLQRVAQHRRVVVDDLVREAISALLDDWDSGETDALEDPSDEQILSDIRDAFDAIKADQTFPASEMIERLRARRKDA